MEVNHEKRNDNMKKFKEYIDSVYETGKLPRGFTPYMVKLLPVIYNDILSRGKAEFLVGDMCRLLNRFGIHTKEYGIGYQAYV